MDAPVLILSNDDAALTSAVRSGRRPSPPPQLPTNSSAPDLPMSRNPQNNTLPQLPPHSRDEQALHGARAFRKLSECRRFGAPHPLDQVVAPPQYAQLVSRQSPPRQPPKADEMPLHERSRSQLQSALPVTPEKVLCGGNECFPQVVVQPAITENLPAASGPHQWRLFGSNFAFRTDLEAVGMAHAHRHLVAIRARVDFADALRNGSSFVLFGHGPPFRWADRQRRSEARANLSLATVPCTILSSTVAAEKSSEISTGLRQLRVPTRWKTRIIPNAQPYRSLLKLSRCVAVVERYPEKLRASVM